MGEMGSTIERPFLNQAVVVVVHFDFEACLEMCGGWKGRQDSSKNVICIHCCSLDISMTLSFLISFDVQA